MCGLGRFRFGGCGALPAEGGDAEPAAAERRGKAFPLIAYNRVMFINVEGRIVNLAHLVEVTAANTIQLSTGTVIPVQPATQAALVAYLETYAVQFSGAAAVTPPRFG